MAYVQPPAAYTYDPNQQPQVGAPPAPAQGGYAPPPQQPVHTAPAPQMAPPQSYAHVPAQAAQPVAASKTFDLDDLLDIGNNGTAAQKSAVPPPPAHAPPPPVNNDPFGFQQQPVYSAQQQQQQQHQQAPVAPPQAPQPPVPQAYTYQPAPQQGAQSPAAQSAYTYQPPAQEAPQPPAHMQPQHQQPQQSGYAHAAADPNSNPYGPPQPYAMNPYAQPQQPQQPPVDASVNPYASMPPQSGMNPYPSMPQSDSAYPDYQSQGAAVPSPTVGSPAPGPAVNPQDQWQRENDADRARLEQLQRMKAELKAADEREAGLKAEKDTWPCPTCTFRSALVESKCQMCQTPRPGYSSSTAVPAPEVKAVSFAPPGQVAQPRVAVNGDGSKWLCPRCSVSNSDAANICKVCNTAKPDHPTAADPPQRNNEMPPAASGNTGGGVSSQEWACAVCTLGNPLTTAACNACQNPRPPHIQVPTVQPAQVVQARPVQPSGATQPGGSGSSRKWTCSTCTFQNSKRAPKCQMCENPQPGYVAPAVVHGGDAPPAGGYPGAAPRPGAGARPAPVVPPTTRTAEEEIKWQDDKFATNCNKCNTQFGLLNRKHHCRSCGFVFCGNCSSNKAKLKPSDREEVRMCLDCFREKTTGGGAPAPGAVGSVLPRAGGGPCDCAMAAEGFHKPGCPSA